jgi:hypothetical protein
MQSRLDFNRDQKSTRAGETIEVMTATPPPATTLLPPHSTPIKIDSSMTLPFTTNQKYRIESCTAMAEEIRRYLVGPMPAQQFLDDFFPPNDLRLRKSFRFTPGCYNETLKAAMEIQAYEPFVSWKSL